MYEASIHDKPSISERGGQFEKFISTIFTIFTIQELNSKSRQKGGDTLDGEDTAFTIESFFNAKPRNSCSILERWRC
jgi:hypothetical protein